MNSKRVRTAPPVPPATREALLHAAGAVFAAHGFRDATVREICDRAGANVAAVNYHFGDKEGLYVEVLRHAMTEASVRHPFDGGLGADAPAEARLRAFVRNLLGRILDADTLSWFGRLLAKEMIEPTRGLDILLDERIRPMAGHLSEIIRDLTDSALDDDALWLGGFSVVSQCLFYNHCRSVVSRLRPDQRLDSQAVDCLADHIARFSLAGIRQLARASRPASPTRTRASRTR